MNIDWNRSAQHTTEARLSLRCYLVALDFLREITDPIVVELYEGLEKAKRLRNIQVPIILSAYDALDTAETVTISREEVPEAFLDRHEVDWDYISSAIHALRAVQAIEFVPGDTSADRYEFKAGSLIRGADREPEDGQGSTSGYIRPSSVNIQHFRWLDKGLALGEQFSGLIEELARAAIEHDPSTNTVRQDTLRKTGIALSVILGNLIRAYQTDPTRFVAIQMGSGDYPQGIYNPYNLGYRAIARSMKYLEEHQPPFVQQYAGNLNREELRGYVSRYRLTQELLERVGRSFSCTLSDTTEEPSGDHFPLTCNTFGTTLAEVSPRDPNSPHELGFYERRYLPALRFKDEDKKLVPHPSDPEIQQEIQRMSVNLEAINAYILEDHWVDLLLPDNEFVQLSRGEIGNENENAFGDRDERNTGGLDLLLDRSLYRVFNNNDITQGGRFYGGWWQNIESKYRQRITINWFPTVEVDYSGMQIAMLYAKEGVQLENDPYQLADMPGEYRSFVKTTMLKMINATGSMTYPRTDSYPEGWDWQRLKDALITKHEPISQHFNSGAGIRLQRQDADIAETVMLKLKQEDILALPVHDSFIVRENYAVRLEEIMLEAYQQVMGQTIEVDQDPFWLEPTPEQMVLHDYGVRYLDESISDLEEAPEYAGYLNRKHNAQRHMGTDWLMTHQWYSG